MKTIIRGILAAVFLVMSLLLLLSQSATSLIETLVADPGQQRLTVFGLVALAGLVSDGLVLALVSAATSWRRRLLHGLGMAGVFVIGLVVLGTAEGPAPAVAPGLLDLSVSWPLTVVGGIGFVGFLLVSIVVRPLPAEVVRMPRALHHYLHDDENPLCRIQQTRLKEPITPDNLVATDQRLIVHHPTNLGLTSVIEDYNYIDIANVKIDRGWLFCTVSMKERFEGHDMVFRNMPKQGGEEFVRIVTDQIQRRQANVPLSRQPAQPEIPVDSEALRILQRRLATGEITPEQYEELRRQIGRQGSKP